jgi:hypothetical protein
LSADEVMPEEFERRESQHPPLDQGTEPTGVACALTALRECADAIPVQLSPRYLYHYCKKSDGIPNLPGTYLRVATQILCGQGVCEHTVWPSQPPTGVVPDDADANASKYRAAGFFRLDDANLPTMLRNMKVWLSTRGCFVAGLWVYESWGKAQAFTTGVIPEATMFDKFWGGHAVCVTGYNDRLRRFTFKNSWGANWGDSGYGYISYEHMTSRCFEAWGIESHGPAES